MIWAQLRDLSGRHTDTIVTQTTCTYPSHRAPRCRTPDRLAVKPVLNGGLWLSLRASETLTYTGEPPTPLYTGPAGRISFSDGLFACPLVATGPENGRPKPEKGPRKPSA